MGEYLIAEVYDALRASKYWEKSLLVVVYDEHGGFFDHVPPPDPVPNPDGKVATDPPFDFTRLGVRVPAILISPWVGKGLIDSTVYEHASIPATVRTLFGLPEGLTARDKAAATFEKNLSLSAPRTDTPLRLPVPGEPREILRLRRLFHSTNLEEIIWALINPRPKTQVPLTLYQQSLVGLTDWLNGQGKGGASPLFGKITHEHEAAFHVHQSLRRYMKKKWPKA